MFRELLSKLAHFAGRARFDDSEKSIKDFRRIFDQESSRMNQAILNDQPSEEIYQETLQTICILVEILSRTRKKDAVG